MMKLCQEEGVGVIPWSPLARGRLTRLWDQQGKTQRAETDEFGKTLYVGTEAVDRRIVDRVAEIASGRGIPMAQLALAWMLHKPFITSPIVGATKLQHLEDAISATEVALSAEEMTRLEELYEPHEVRGFE
jgi:aryl-alcohol dehydrogenase-like predicted oxidoreductase